MIDCNGNFYSLTLFQNKDLERENEIAAKLASELAALQNNVLNPVVEGESQYLSLSPSLLPFI